jgi:hypothetical protein
VGTTTRTAGGRFGSAYDDLELYEIVRAVAEFAAPEAPTQLAQTAWDAARADAGYADAPTARAICMRLADSSGRPFPWRELLELVFDESRNIEQTHGQRTAAPMAVELDEEDIYYALRRVARAELDQASLRPDEYRRERERLIAEARRRRNGQGELVAELLPTVGQIERIAGGWDAALVLAELEPRAPVSGQAHGRRGIPIAEVLDRFADETGGWFCRVAQLQQYARDRQIVTARRADGMRWADYLAEAAARRQARGAVVLGLPPREVYPTYPGMTGGAKDRGSDTSDAGPASEAIKPPGYWTLARCVEAVRRYLDDPETKKPSQGRYRAWASGRPDAPAPSTFARFGGWKAVSRLARSRKPLPPEEKVESPRERVEAIVLAHLAKHGRIASADLQAAANLSRDAAGYVLRGMRDRGTIAVGSKHAQGRWVFYVPPPSTGQRR